jgi:hypothetical protein
MCWRHPWLPHIASPFSNDLRLVRHLGFTDRDNGHLLRVVRCVFWVHEWDDEADRLRKILGKGSRDGMPSAEAIDRESTSGGVARRDGRRHQACTVHGQWL